MLNRAKSDICPVCKARLTSKTVCRRCKTDIVPLMDIRSRAVRYRDKALTALKRSEFQEMLLCARRSHTLFSTNESARLLFCASLLADKNELTGFLLRRVSDIKG